ncbi:DsbA family protein [Streptomyces sp. NPDC053474]|uniref:DsbA family protein n=1 Tax=Streptomyces sp. NPDC053474 TaxID=3365704 RepID=UPI0037D9285B
MTVTVDVWFDFICPYSLITRHVLAKALHGRDAVPAFHPFEVNPNCVEEAGEYPRGVWENSVRPLGAERGVHLAGPPGTPLRRARMALLGYQYAREHGAGARYTDLVFSAYFHHWQDISDPTVLADLAVEAGLDRAGFRAAIMSARYARAHQQSLAHARGPAQVTMVPVIVAGQRRIDGVPTAEELARAVEEALAASAVPAVPAVPPVPPVPAGAGAGVWDMTTLAPPGVALPAPVPKPLPSARARLHGT